MIRFAIGVLFCLGTAPCQAESFFDLLQELAGFGESTPMDAAVEDAEESIEQVAVEVDEFAPIPNIVTDGVILHGLDKETARVFSAKAKVGDTVEFGTLKIKIHHCETAPPEEHPESAAFLTINEERPGEAKQNLFSGWMFASSPAISALDHPVYDVWVKSCTAIETP